MATHLLHLKVIYIIARDLLTIFNKDIYLEKAIECYFNEGVYSYAMQIVAILVRTNAPPP